MKNLIGTLTHDLVSTGLMILFIVFAVVFFKDNNDTAAGLLVMASAHILYTIIGRWMDQVMISKQQEEIDRLYDEVDCMEFNQPSDMDIPPPPEKDVADIKKDMEKAELFGYNNNNTKTQKQ